MQKNPNFSAYFSDEFCNYILKTGFHSHVSMFHCAQIGSTVLWINHQFWNPSCLDKSWNFSNCSTLWSNTVVFIFAIDTSHCWKSLTFYGHPSSKLKFNKFCKQPLSVSQVSLSADSRATFCSMAESSVPEIASFLQNFGVPVEGSGCRIHLLLLLRDLLEEQATVLTPGEMTNLCVGTYLTVLSDEMQQVPPPRNFSPYFTMLFIFF